MESFIKDFGEMYYRSALTLQWNYQHYLLPRHRVFIQEKYVSGAYLNINKFDYRYL